MSNNDTLIEKHMKALGKYIKDKKRLIAICEIEIEEYKQNISLYEESIKTKTDYTTNQILAILPESNQLNDTKTQKTYKLPSGEIIIKKDQNILKLKEDIDLDNLNSRFIETKRTVKWADLKSVLTVEKGEVVNTQTGEIMDDVIIEIKKGKTEIKLYSKG